MALMTEEKYWRRFSQTGLRIESLREGCPQRERSSTAAAYERRKRIPLFLMVGAVK
jgi:hypothetical protein